MSRKTCLNIPSEALAAYWPVVFWSINSALEEGELRRQIDEMKRFSLGGFVFHARAGLETEYLSEDWFRCVSICLDEAKKQGLRVWLYDEYGWPSGFAGGRLLADEQNRALYFTYEVKDTFDGAAYAVYALEEGVPRLLKAGERAAQYHTLYLHASDAYVDILDGRVTRQFISLTHEQYYARFAPSFGRELLGFFTDEPQYYRYATPFTRVAEEEYRAAYGEDIRKGLLWLFLKDERGYPFRVRYYSLLNRLYCENYYRIVYEWCEEHGCMLTGHSIEENAFFAQMWGGADCATSYLFEHVPAIDNLARHSDPFLSAKNVASAAAQTGREHVLTETFGCTGYGVTPRMLRRIAERQYVYGVNTMCQHLYNYSLAGQGKTDHPVSFGRALPWADGYAAFNEYFAKLGALLGTAREEAPVAVITPMESVYLDYVRLDEGQTIREVDGGYSEVILALRREGIACHLVDEKILSRLGSVENGRLRVGERTYDAVVLANCRELKASTAALLKRYLESGGALRTMGQPPRYVDGVPRDLTSFVRNDALPRPDCIEEMPIPYTIRTLRDGRKLVFAVNDGDAPAQIAVRGEFSRVDLVRGEGYAPAERYTVPAGESILLEEAGGYTQPALKTEAAESVVPVFAGSDANSLTLTDVSVVTEEGEMHGYCYGVFERLVKRGVRGTMEVTFSFESELAAEADLVMERQPVQDVRFNGEPCIFEQTQTDCNFIRAHVRVCRGVNRLVYRARLDDVEHLRKVLFGDTPESLRNCISYHTCLEPVWVEGTFDTCGGRMTACGGKAAGDLTRMGYEHFCGKVRYTAIVRGGGSVRVCPVGDFAMCELTLSGQTKTVFLDEGAVFDLPPGEHVLNIAVSSTMRNRYGPFHCDYAEENGVSPDHFTLRGGWSENGKNEHYTASVQLVPFGLREVRIERLRAR